MTFFKPEVQFQLDISRIMVLMGFAEMSVLNWFWVVPTNLQFLGRGQIWLQVMAEIFSFSKSDLYWVLV